MKFYALKIVALLLMVSTIAFSEDPGGLDIRTVDDIPILWSEGMPYFTRFDRTDHKTHDLSGMWKFRLEPEGSDGENWYGLDLDDSDWEEFPVPGSWNIYKDEWLYHRGAGWYRLRFEPPEFAPGNFQRLVLDGVAFTGHVYLNGKFVGSHQGGFTRWYLDITDIMEEGENLLAIRVDNRRDFQTLPPLRGEDGKLGWWFYGGIKRPPFIESSPPTTLAKLAVTTDHEGRLDAAGIVYSRGVSKSGAREASLHVRLISPDGKEVLSRGPIKVSINADGLGSFSLDEKIEDVKAWSPDTPDARYFLQAELESADGKETQAVEFGFRKFEFRGHKSYLNGKPLFLRGINRHEEYPGIGPVFSEEATQKDMALLHELHVNFIRPAHYPNDPRWLDSCDREGIMVTHEIPFYRVGISMKSAIEVWKKPLYENAARQLIEMIERDRNHASIVMWSIGNENRDYQPGIRRFHSRLIKICRMFDPERPVTFAFNTGPMPGPWLDITGSLADALFINSYFGWYERNAEEVGAYYDHLHRRWPQKPIIVSEFGAGAWPEADGTKVYKVGGLTRDFTESYQAELYRTHLDAILARPYITGIMPWIFADFRDYKRPDNPRPDFNLKGVVTFDRERKEAFLVLADTYESIEAGEHKFGK